MRAVDPRVSFAELSAWPDDGRRYELYEGEPIVVPAPNWRHQRIVTNLVVVLKDYENRAGGSVVVAPFDIVLSDYDVLQPDVVFFSEPRVGELDPLEAAYIVPDLAVEVLSRSTEMRDRGRKMLLLARYGLPEYWLVDPDAHVLELYGQSAGKLELVETFEHGSIVTSATLDGLAFPIDNLFDQ